MRHASASSESGGRPPNPFRFKNPEARKCFNCGRSGHLIADCPAPKRKARTHSRTGIKDAAFGDLYHRMRAAEDVAAEMGDMLREQSTDQPNDVMADVVPFKKTPLVWKEPPPVPEEEKVAFREAAEFEDKRFIWALDDKDSDIVRIASSGDSDPEQELVFRKVFGKLPILTWMASMILSMCLCMIGCVLVVHATAESFPQERRFVIPSLDFRTWHYEYGPLEWKHEFNSVVLTILALLSYLMGGYLFATTIYRILRDVVWVIFVRPCTVFICSISGDALPFDGKDRRPDVLAAGKLKHNDPQIRRVILERLEMRGLVGAITIALNMRKADRLRDYLRRSEFLKFATHGWIPTCVDRSVSYLSWEMFSQIATPNNFVFSTEDKLAAQRIAFSLSHLHSVNYSRMSQPDLHQMTVCAAYGMFRHLKQTGSMLDFPWHLQ